MSIKEVPMWRVECDVCGKDSGSDWYAWTEWEQALDEFCFDGWGFRLAGRPRLLPRLPAA